MSEEQSGFGTWAIVELMGHVKVAGYVTEEERFGVKMGRIDVPGPDGDVAATQFFGGSSVYRITPVTEEVARAYAVDRVPSPVSRWDLPELRQAHEEVRRLQAQLDDAASLTDDGRQTADGGIPFGDADLIGEDDHPFFVEGS